MFEYLATIRLWLEATIDPAAPWVLLTAAIFLAVNGTKKYWPSLWLWFDKVTPDGGVLGHTVMALPSVALGAVSSWLLTGGDLAVMWKGAVWGALAPLLHLLAKSYQGGTVGTPKPPSSAGTVALILSVFLVGCTPQQVQSGIQSAVDVAKDVENIAKVLCLLDQAKIRGSRADLVQDACSTVEAVGPYVPAARAMQANPRAMVACK